MGRGSRCYRRWASMWGKDWVGMSKDGPILSRLS